MADLMAHVKAALAARHAGPAVHPDAFVVQPRHLGSRIRACDQGSGRVDGRPRIALLHGYEESPAVAARLCLRHIVAKPFGCSTAVQPRHRAGRLRRFGKRSGARHEYTELARPHLRHHPCRLFRKFGEGGERRAVALEPPIQVGAAEAHVQQVRGDGACGELDRDIGRRVHPSIEVVVSCSADEVAKFIAQVSAHILGRPDL